MKKLLPYLIPFLINPTMNFNAPVDINLGTQTTVNVIR